jgi:lipid-A-disaccharide synthase
VNVLISTGEVSGDLAAARLVEELRRRRPDVIVSGIGGSRMEQAGVRLLFRTSHLGTVGLTEVCANIPSLARAWRALRRHVLAGAPDIAILVGNDLFNVVFARWLRRHGVRTVAYFPPQVWIWRALAGPVARSFDLILASFADEQAVYGSVSRGPDVVFVGHYLADDLRPVTPDQRRRARIALGLEDATVVTLMPGSRKQELHLLAPVLLDAAADLLRRDTRLRFVLPVADRHYAEPIRHAVAARGLGPYVALAGEGREAIRASNLALLASGTASLEAALLDVPMVVVYRVSALSYVAIRACIATGLIESAPVGLPNLLLGGRVVPELLQWRLTARRLADEAWTMLTNTEREHAVRAALSDVRAVVTGPACVERAVDAIGDFVGRTRPERSVASSRGPCDRSPSGRGATPGGAEVARAPALRSSIAERP